MRRTTDILLAGLLLLTIGACVDRINAGLLQKEQSGQVTQRQIAGGDLTNTTVNIVGDDVLLAGAGILGLMAFGWWYAARGRKVNSAAVKDIVQGVEQFKGWIKAEQKPSNPVAIKSLTMSQVQEWLEAANNRKQSKRTQAIVRKIRGKPKKTK